MMVRLALALVLAPLAACGGSYTLDEAEGIEAARTAFIRHTIYPSSTRPLGPVRVDEVDLQLTIDGWSLADKLGFEYVSDGDPDTAPAPTEISCSSSSMPSITRGSKYRPLNSL